MKFIENDHYLMHDLRNLAKQLDILLVPDSEFNTPDGIKRLAHNVSLLASELKNYHNFKAFPTADNILVEKVIAKEKSE